MQKELFILTRLLHSNLPQEVRKELGDVLSYVMRKCMLTEEISQNWRDCNILPIYKRIDNSAPGNYRPVCLTCIVCKVMIWRREA